MDNTRPIKILSPAKINLTLDILGKHTMYSGDYHTVNTILHEIPLYDEITFTRIPEKRLIITCDNPAVPTDERNTVHKAITLLLELRQTPDSDDPLPGIAVHIKKNIPVASGLGGGASNAASALNVLNQLWELELSTAQLRKIAAQIGMDAPFFIKGGTAYGTHFGEQIAQLPLINLSPLLIVLDDVKTSTEDLYKRLDITRAGKHIDKTSSFISNPTALNLLHNDFETALPQVRFEAFKKYLLQSGADVVHICGSGPALYALFRNKHILKTAYNELEGKVRFVWNSA